MQLLRISVILLVFIDITCAEGLSGNPPGLGMSVKELFGRWLRSSGGEAAWKGIIDIEFDLIGTVRFSGVLIEERERHVRIKLQPRLRMKMEFTDPKKRRTIFARDGRGWFKYKEGIPKDQGWWDRRNPQVYDDFETKDEVSFELKGIGFWLGMPFILQRPGVRIRFAGFLKPLVLGDKPLPMLEIDLTALKDWPIDLLVVALSQRDWQPVEARYRFRGEDEMPNTCIFFDFVKTKGLYYPSTRVFYDDTKPSGERVEKMVNVVANTWIHQDEFKRPNEGEHWYKRRQ